VVTSGSLPTSSGKQSAPIPCYISAVADSQHATGWKFMVTYPIGD